MRDLGKQLEAARAMQQSVVTQANQLEQQKQSLIQEALRLDGEIRLLERMANEGGKHEPDRDKSKD